MALIVIKVGRGMSLKKKCKHKHKHKHVPHPKKITRQKIMGGAVRFSFPFKNGWQLSGKSAEHQFSGPKVES